jgi:hypothetical protein
VQPNVSKKILGDLRSPTAPPASHRDGARRELRKVTPPSHCASQFVFRGTDKRIGHHEQLIVCQLSFTLPSESRLVRPELDTVEFQAQAVRQRLKPKSATSHRAKSPPCAPSSKPNVRRWRQACLPARLPSSHARDKLHLVCSRVSLAGRSI